MSSEEIPAFDFQPESKDGQGPIRFNPTPQGAPEPSAAERYIAGELQKMRASMTPYITVGLVVLALLGGEVLYLTNGFTSNLEPHAAAEVAEGFMAQQVNDKGPEVAAQIKQKIPEMIQQAPDYALKQLPAYRESLENKLESDLTSYCQSTAPKLTKNLDEFLAAHKNEVRDMLTKSDDPNTVKQMGEQLKGTMMSYLEEKGENGESAEEQIDKSLTALNSIHTTMHRLANNEGLTPQEKKMRRAIAVLSRSIQENTSDVKDQIAAGAQAGEE